MECEDYTIVCLCVDRDKEIFGSPFKIKVSPSEPAYSLKSIVLEKNKLLQTFYFDSYIDFWMLTPPLDINKLDSLRKCRSFNLPEIVDPDLVHDEIRLVDWRGGKTLQLKR